MIKMVILEFQICHSIRFNFQINLFVSSKAKRDYFRDTKSILILLTIYF